MLKPAEKPIQLAAVVVTAPLGGDMGMLEEVGGAVRAIGSALNLAGQRARAVRLAWAEERALVEATGAGTRAWTDAEKAELLETGRVKGYEGHHINSVNGNPELAGDPNNIEFVRGRSEHLDRHNGNFRNPTSGPTVDRKPPQNDE